MLEKIGSGKVLISESRHWHWRCRGREILRTRLMASSRAFLSSIRLALLTLTTSRLLGVVGGMGNTERGGGVAVESEGESTAGAGLVPLTPFLTRAMIDLIAG